MKGWLRYVYPVVAMVVMTVVGLAWLGARDPDDGGLPSRPSDAADLGVTGDSGVEGAAPDSATAGAVTRRLRIREVTLTVELADTPAARSRGLAARPSIPAGTGMLFVFEREITTGFYMYRTLVPLSIVFAHHGRVVTVREMAPCTEEDSRRCEVYRADEAYTEAIEAPGGTFSNAGIRPGDLIEFL